MVTRCKRAAERRPAGRGQEIGRRTVAVVETAREHLGSRVGMREQRRARRADHSVGDREQRVDRPARSRDRRRRRRPTIPAPRRHAARPRAGAAGPRATRRIARARPARCSDAGRHAVRFDADRAHRRRRAVSGTSISESLPGIRPRSPNSSPPMSTSSAAIPSRRSSRKHRARGITLVGQADLDVLGVARDLRIRAARRRARRSPRSRRLRAGRRSRPRRAGW